MMMHHVPWVAMGAFGYGAKFPSTLGIFGGYATPPAFISTVGQSNAKTLLAESNTHLPTRLEQVYEEGNPEQGMAQQHNVTMNIQPLMNGDTFYVPVGGGAGYGDVLERAPMHPERLKEGMVSHWAAQNVYRIVYDEETLRLNEEKTRELREQVRKKRISRGRPFDEFEAEWGKLRPSDQAIKHYGAYPHPSEGPPPGPPGM